MAGNRETRPHHPFSNSIMSAPLPEGFEPPRIQQYDGSSDPDDHLAKFNAHMLLYGATATDPIMCRAFPCSLTKFALRWFSTLPPKSINNFSQFTTKFLNQFAFSKTYRKTMQNSCLTNLEQLPEESLKDYLYRFNQEAIQIDDLSPKLLMSLIKDGLQPGPFWVSLQTKPPRTMDDFWQEATCYINREVYNKRRLEMSIECYNDTVTSSM